MNKNTLKLIAAVFLAVAIFLVGIAVSSFMNDGDNDGLTADNTSSTVSDNTSSVNTESSNTTSSDVASSDTSNITSSETASSEKNESSKVQSTTSSNNSSTNNSSSTTERPIQNTLFPGYKYNTTLNIEDNVFIDSLVYTGYNLEKHRADGLMWEYVLSKYKRGKGWLSNISFGGGSTGLETTPEGLPDIKFFEKKNLVCASFASYVYFNYLPNVAKIDTSALELPEDTKSANSFYQACKKWLKSGQTYNIGFTAKDKAAGIEFTPDEEIPLGSIIVFRDKASPGKTSADHITIYVGEKNGYHWVIQTGNKNGPEFCAVERFKFGPDPQWPLAIFATPKCIYDAIGAQQSGN